MKVLVTGSAGRIGRVLMQGLNQHRLMPADLPDTDLTDYKQTLAAVSGVDAVIHLAFRRTSHASAVHADNFTMADHVLRAAHESGVKRLVLASSVHADEFYTFPRLTPVRSESVPTGPYGASKLYAEALGCHYAHRGLSVMAIRLGGVNEADQKPADSWEARVWLTHTDLISFVQAVLVAPLVPYAASYVVSNNPGQVHDTVNSYGWKAKQLAS